MTVKFIYYYRLLLKEAKKMNIEEVFNIKETKENEYCLSYKERELLLCNDEEKEPLSKLVESLNIIFTEKEYEYKSYRMMMDFYQKLISDTLSDKLDNIDNLYAMKKMMTEICNSIESMTKNLKELQDEQKK